MSQNHLRWKLLPQILLEWQQNCKPKRQAEALVILKTAYKINENIFGYWTFYSCLSPLQTYLKHTNQSITKTEKKPTKHPQSMTFEILKVYYYYGKRPQNWLQPQYWLFQLMAICFKNELKPYCFSFPFLPCAQTCF